MIKDWWKPKVKTGWTVDRSMGYTGPAKPRVRSATTMGECQYVRMNNGDTGALIGPWINNGKWDGSYVIVHADECVGFYFPKVFSWTGFTIDEAIEVAELNADIKKKRGQKEKEGAAS